MVVAMTIISRTRFDPPPTTRKSWWVPPTTTTTLAITDEQESASTGDKGDKGGGGDRTSVILTKRQREGRAGVYLLDRLMGLLWGDGRGKNRVVVCSSGAEEGNNHSYR